MPRRRRPEPYERFYEADRPPAKHSSSLQSAMLSVEDLAAMFHKVAMMPLAPRGSGKTPSHAFSGLRHLLTTAAPAVPESPFPYGAVIKPTAANLNFPPEHRQMVIGMAPGYPEAISAIDLAAASIGGNSFYMHTISNIHDRWEEAE